MMEKGEKQKIMTNYQKTINQQEWSKCRALPSPELQECALEAHFSLYSVPQPLPIHKGRNGPTRAALRRDHSAQRHPGQMRISRQSQPQQLPTDSSFLPTLHTESQLQPLQPAVQGGRITARAVPLGTGWSCRCFMCCRQDSAAVCGCAVPEVGVIAQAVVQNEGLQDTGALIRQFSTLNASMILYLLQSLALSKKRPSMIKVKGFPSSQHTPHHSTAVFSNTNRAGTSTTQAPNSSYTHPPSSAQHSQSSWSLAREHN